MYLYQYSIIHLLFRSAIQPLIHETGLVESSSGFSRQHFHVANPLDHPPRGNGATNWRVRVHM